MPLKISPPPRGLSQTVLVMFLFLRARQTLSAVSSWKPACHGCLPAGFPQSRFILLWRPYFGPSSPCLFLETSCQPEKGKGTSFTCFEVFASCSCNRLSLLFLCLQARSVALSSALSCLRCRLKFYRLLPLQPFSLPFVVAKTLGFSGSFGRA